MAKNIRYRGQSSEDNQMLNLILPDFVLCVRDFTLELEFDGKVISSNEYLETSLASKKGKASKFNKPRECIRKYFPKRECFAFPMPGDTSVIRKTWPLMTYAAASERQQLHLYPLSMIFHQRKCQQVNQSMDKVSYNCRVYH
jgi:hypothetical protein